MKVFLTRAWYKLAPKVLTFLATGLTASGLVLVADKYFNFTIEPGIAGFIVTAISFVAGYIKTDTVVLGENGATITPADPAGPVG